MDGWMDGGRERFVKDGGSWKGWIDEWLGKRICKEGWMDRWRELDRNNGAMDGFVK